MSMTDDTQDTDGEAMVPRSHIRQLEEKAKRATDAEARLAALERENAFTRVLGNDESPFRPYFERGYEGELTPEAIRQAATEAGLLASAQAPQPSGPPPDALAHQRVAQAAQGAAAPPPENLSDAIANATSADEVMRIMSQATDPQTGQSFPTTWNRPGSD